MSHPLKRKAIQTFCNLSIILSITSTQVVPVAQAATVADEKSNFNQPAVTQILELTPTSSPSADPPQVTPDSGGFSPTQTPTASSNNEDPIPSLELDETEPTEAPIKGGSTSHQLFLPLVQSSYIQSPTDGPELSIQISDQGLSADPGGAMHYTLSFKNYGVRSAKGVLITETLPDHTTFLASGSSQGWQRVGSSNQYTFSVGRLTAGDTGTITFAIQLDYPFPRATTILTNTATIEDDGSIGDDPIPENNQASETTPVNPPPPSPDLFIEIDTEQTEITPGSLLTYTIHYSNIGTETSTGVVITETLPENAAFDAAASSTGWQQEGTSSTYHYAMGELGIEAEGNAQFAVRVDNPAAAGVTTITNRVSITDDETHSDEYDPSNNTDDLNTPLNAYSDLTISVDDQDQAGIPGEELIYTITYANAGNQNTAEVVIAANLPEHTTFKAASSTSGWQQVGTTREYHLNIGELNGGANGVAAFAVEVISIAPAGLDNLQFSASIADGGVNGEDPTPADNSASITTFVDAAPDLSLQKSDADLDFIVPGNGIVYTLQYGNTANQNASGVQIVETLPENTAFNLAQSSAGWQRIGSTNQYRYTIGNLNVSTTGSTLFAVTVNEAIPEGVTVISNTATIEDDAANGADQTPADNSAVKTTTLNLSPDLTLSKTGDGLTQPGSLLKYTLTYGNEGYTAASGVVITETIPANTTFNATESDPAWQQVGTSNQYSYSVGDLAVDASGSVVFAVAVSNPVPQGTVDVENTAQISDDGTHGVDPEPENNTAIFTSLLSSGPTNVSGTISSNTTWGAEQSPYIVTGNVVVNSGVTLTIEPGAIVKFNATSRTLTVNGTLNAQGTSQKPIIFTSYKDDTAGGDSNGDGSATTPAPGNWQNITISDTGTANISYATIRYGGYSSSYNANLYLLNNATAVLDHVTVSNSLYYGVRASGTASGKTTRLTMTNSRVEQNTNRGVYLNVSSGATQQTSITNTIFDQNGSDGLWSNYPSGVTLTSNTFTGNNGYAVSFSLSSSTLGSLTNNQGADNAKNGIALTGTIGQDTTLSYSSGLVYILPSGGLTVNSGVTLTIPAGQVIKADSTSSTLTVNGTLNAAGTAGAPIYLTSIKDDSVGGDSNHDGTTTTPAAGDWMQIAVANSGVVDLAYTVLRYGGNSGASNDGMLYQLGNGRLTLDHSSLEYSATRGIYYLVNNAAHTSGTLNVTNSEIAHSNWDGIVASQTAGSPLVANISASTLLDNGSSTSYHGISITGSNTTSITDCAFQENGGDGVYNGNADALTMRGNVLNANGRYAAYLSIASGSPVDITGNSCSGNAKNGIALTGTIGQDTTLPYSSSLVYIIPGSDLTINEGATLTIPAGQVIKADSAGSQIVVKGSLITQGTELQSVYITSIKDDSVGGDTNNDDEVTTPSPGDWQRIFVTGNGSISSYHTEIRYGGSYYDNYNHDVLTLYGNVQSLMDHSSIRYSMHNGIKLSNISTQTTNLTLVDSSVGYNSKCGISTESANGTVQLVITNSQIEGNVDYGVFIYTNNILEISNSEIRDNGNAGIYVTKSMLMEIADNQIEGNGGNGVTALTAIRITMSNNSFVDNDGYAASLSFLDGTFDSNASNSGSGNAKNGIALTGTIGQDTTLSYSSSLVYIIPGSDLTINEGATLTIPAGQVIKADSTDSQLIIEGILSAQGTITSRIIITSINDDSAGGDDNDDDVEISPTSGDWQNIIVKGYGKAYINYAIIKFGGSTKGLIALYENALIEIRNSQISNSSNSGFYSQSESGNHVVLHIENCFIESNALAGIEIVGENNISIINNQIINNNSGIVINNSEGTNFILKNNNSSYNAKYPYEFSGYLDLDLTKISNNNAEYNGIQAINLSSVIVKGFLANIPNLVYVISNSGETLDTCNSTLISPGLFVKEGDQLSIEPGTIIKFKNHKDWIKISGEVLANGSAFNPIVFTSINDDVYGGDTLNDSNTTIPQNGEWGGILVSSTGKFQINNSQVLYSGYFKYGNYSYLSNCWGHRYEYGTNSAITAEGNSEVNITNSQFFNSAGYGLAIFTNEHTITNNSFYNNNNFAVFNGDIENLVVKAENNWWGSSSGPAPYGSGNGINYKTCYNSSTGTNYICQYYVDVSPWTGQSQFYGKAANYQKTVSDPVNTATGNYINSSTDLSINTRSLPLQLTRSYNSASPEDGVMGFGWSQSYRVRAAESSADQSVTITFGDGHTERFAWNGSSYVAPAGVYSNLEKVDGLFHLTLKDSTVYAFDTQGRLNMLTDRNGNVTSLTYTGSALDRVTAPDGRELTFTYNDSGRLAQVTDPLNRTVQYGYDDDGNLTSVTDATGKVTAFAYDTNHRLLSITDANNHTFITNVYNDEGRVIEQYDAQDHLTTLDYDILNHLTTVTDALGHVTYFQYDDNLRLTSEKNGLGKVESYTYDSNNNRLTVTDRNGHVTSMTYDTKGNVLTQTNAKNGLSTYTYDENSNLLTITDPKNHATTYTYDENGNRLTATDALNHTTTYTYYSASDYLGLLHTVKDPRNNTTTYAYNTQGDVTSITNALGNLLSYTYDQGGRKESYTDSRNHTWTYTYDNLNRVLTETDPLSGVTTYTYDAVGNQLTREDQNHNVTTYVYDEKDKLVSVTNAEGYAITYTYDAIGNKLTETDGNSHTTTYGYDAADRLVTITDALNNTVTYGYDHAGNQVTVTDALNHTTTTAYDELNRPVSVTDPLGHSTSTTYDAVGNVLTLTDANNHTTTYTYTDLNQLETVTDALDGIVTYGYDADGNRTSLLDANGHTTTYTYDALNRLSTTTDPLIHTTTHTYDANGNQSTTLDANGNTATYTYDELNRLINVANNDGTSVAYSYDGVGNRLTMVDSQGTTAFTYDNLYRPLTITSPEGVTGYTYDAINRLTLTAPAGTTTYSYNAINQLLTTTDWDNQSTTYTYDTAGRQVGVAYPNGVSTNTTYDNANRITNITTVKDGTTLSSITYTMDNLGNRLTMVDGDGTTTYTYDELNRLFTVAYPTGSPANVSYTYDAMGNRLTLVQDGVTTSYTYNHANQLQSTVTSGVTTSYTWDNNGNLLTKGSQTFAWNRAGRLAGLVNGGTATSYTYNGDGVRVGKTVNGISTTYLQDQAAGLPVVIREATDGVTNDYVYGTDLLASDGGSWSFYHTDGLGSTRLLTNSVGTVTDRYGYDAFGTERYQTGSSTQSFTYTGEQVDPEAGLVYLRARYYDPEVGRFISKDRYTGLDSSSQSINNYIYVQNNPIVIIDPSGYFGIMAGLDWLLTGLDVAGGEPQNPASLANNAIGDVAGEMGYDAISTGSQLAGGVLTGYSTTNKLNDIWSTPSQGETLEYLAKKYNTTPDDPSLQLWMSVGGDVDYAMDRRPGQIVQTVDTMLEATPGGFGLGYKLGKLPQKLVKIWNRLFGNHPDTLNQSQILMNTDDSSNEYWNYSMNSPQSRGK